MPEGLKFENGTDELALITGLRDEAHRFAISFNRASRSKSMKKNVLEELPGFGPATRRKLLKAAGSVDALKDLGQETLESLLSASQIETLRNHALIP